MFGKQFYPLVHALNNKRAPKIIGMLLEMDNEFLNYLIKIPAALQDKIEEANGVLRDYKGNI